VYKRQPETIRGHTAKTVYLMECNFIRDSYDLYTAILFTINTTNGYIIAESTPWNSDSVFYSIYHDQAYSQFSTHTVPYTEALPPNGPLNTDIVEMIRTQLKGDSARWRREMLCQWTEDADTWLPTSLLTLAQDNDITYHDLAERLRGNFYAGVDFGKKQDHSVVAVIEIIGKHKFMRHMHQFPLDTPYGAVIGYLKRLQDSWSRVVSIYADRTGVGEYIVEDMERGGLRYVTGINFTDTSKEAMATALKENMRTAECPACDWKGFVDTKKGEWTTSCPEGCRDDYNNRISIRPMLHIPYDPDLYTELNVERYELSKTGKLLYNHPEGTHDDRFWALALAIYAADSITTSKPVAKLSK